MLFVINQINLIDQKEVEITVIDESGNTHLLLFDPIVFIDCSDYEKKEIIRRALKDLLAHDLNLAGLIGETVTVDNLYKKAYG